MNQRLFKTTLFVFVALVSGVVSAQGLLNRRAGLLNSRTGQRSAQRAGGAQQAPADEAETSTEDILKDIPKGTNGVPTRLAFDQAPLEVLLYAYADVAGKILIPAPNLPKTQITLKTFEDRELTKEEYLEAIEVTLTMNGVVLEPFDKIFLRAFERKTVRTQGIRTSMDMPTTNSIPEKGKVVSQLIRLQHITAEEAQKALEGFKDPNGLFQVFERNNTILVTDTQENLNRMLEVVRELDVATPVTEDVFVRQIQYAAAMEIKTALETIVTESQKDAQQAKGGAPKESGAPGFGGGTRPSLQPNRLLNLNRPGLNKPEPPPTTPNATMMAQVSDADRGMIRGKVLILADERSNKLIVITAKTNMDFFDKVIETLDVETTPEVEVEVIRLKYAESEDVASMLNDLIGNGSSSSSQAKNNQNANTAKNGTANRNLTQTRAGAGGAATRPQTANPTFSKSASSSLGELNKDNIKILADKRINGIVVMARKADMRAVKEVIEDMDVKLSQVLIETVIIEVTLGDDLKTGIDWVQRGRQKVTTRERMKDELGNELFWELDDEGKPTTTTTTTDTGFEAFHSVSRMVRDGFYNNGNYMLGGGAGTGSGMLGALVNAAGQVVSNDTAVTAANPIGGGLNYLLKSDKLNLAAVIQASKTDTRAKYIASPIVMTVDNKEAIVEATESRKFYSGSTTTTSYSTPVTSYSYTDKDIGIKIKVTPKINPDGTVMLTVEEEYSQLGAGQSVLVSGSNGSTQQEPIDTAVSRKMSADVLLDNMQTVILGGLTETYKSDKETGIPILKDIPWIGKWLFGSVTQNETRKELLVFMTPYVLDDADAAQAEAIRRKKSMSDPRPWEDNGWSLSTVADPVAKKELLRRLNDEWSRQDEERRNQKALEEAKAKRAKKLAEMDEEERREWAEKHQKEILEEQERFEGEQNDLREIIDSIREKRKPEEATPVAEPGNEAASAPKSE